MFWIVVILVFLVLVLAFIIIARKGRELRRAQPLPPPVKTGFLRWVDNSKTLEEQIHPPFYIGRKSDSHVVIDTVRTDYEVCISIIMNDLPFNLSIKPVKSFITEKKN